LKRVQEKVDIAIVGKKIKCQNDNEIFKIGNYTELDLLEIKSEYSSCIGIENGKIYIKSNAEKELKEIAKGIGIQVK